MDKRALKDIMVLDLTRVLAGPYCTMMLADFGANVIKIEVPVKGDDTRGMGPFKNGESLYYANVNRGKKGITLNLKTAEGKKMFLELSKKADVVVENYRPGVMDKLGLGYDVLSEINPNLIYAAVSGYGSYGPDSRLPGYDIIAQAVGGLMSITGEEGGAPLRAGSAIGDVLGGLNLTIGVLTALHARMLTGKGQRVDVALVDSVVASLETGLQRYFASGEVPKRMGNRYAAGSPYDSFEAKDGYFVIGCGNDKLFMLLCTKAINRPELLTDRRFQTNAVRCENEAALKREIELWTKEQTVASAVAAITAAGVPAAPINDLKTLAEDRHIAQAREMFVAVEHPIIGKMRVNGNPVKLLDTMPVIREPSPELGQHNYEIYGTLLGLSKNEIDELKMKSVL